VTTDTELFAILLSSSGDYTAEAIEVAREEFNRRKLGTSALAELDTAVEVKDPRRTRGWI